MNLLPEIVDGEIVENKEPELYTPPAQVYTRNLKEEERQHELNNLGRRKVAEDFSDYKLEK